MTIMRVHKTKNFTVMSNHHFKEKEMSLKAKGLLSLMLSLPDDWNYSVSGLVTLSKDGKDSVMSALGELEKFGYLKRDRLTDPKGRFKGIEYNIYEEPQRENPIAGNQNSGNQHAGEQNAENPPLLNTNSINNEFNKELKESNTYREFESVLSSVVNSSLKELYYEYIEMRESIDAPITPRGLKLLIQRCERLSNMNVSVQHALLETAIIHNWKNVYSPQEKSDSEVQYRNNNAWRQLKDFYGV